VEGEGGVSDLLIQKSAIISPCGVWRYRLTRVWSSAPLLPFVMLNPSIADADIDDPTIRRCMSFAQRESAGGIMVVNLYALRATDPARLKADDNPIGPDNDDHIRELASGAFHTSGSIVCAWGANAALARSVNVATMIRGEGAVTVCLGTTRSGEPRHPLYVRGDQPLVPFG